MNPTSHHLEGELLDYAYGELSESEAKTVEAHLSDCPQCADSLTAMKQVRRTMAQLPIAAAPQAGLESLLAYAQKAAESARARPARRRTWLRWIVPVGSVAALSLVLVLSSKVMMQHRPEGAATFKRDDTRGDWESPPPPSAKKDAEAAEKTSVVFGVRQAPAKAAEVPAPKDLEGAGVPVASEPAGSPEADRLSAAGEGNGARKVKVAAAPKPARRAAAPSNEGEAREEVEGGVMGGVVGGVIGGVPESKPSGDTVAPAKVASEHAADSAQLKQTVNASGARPSAPSSPAAPPIDRELEVAQLRQALATAQGPERARLLRRLCDALDALGRTRDADSACDTVVREFPASEEAKSALKRLKVRAADADKSKSGTHP